MSQFIEMFTDKGYPLTMIKSFADVSTGGTPSKAHPEYWNGDKPWVSAEDMKSKYVYDTCEKVTVAGYATCKIVPVDTLMYVCRGSIGVMAINKIECATNQSICRATCHNNVCNVEFLYHALMYQRDNIKKKGTGTSFKSLNQTTFSELEIGLPPYDEQMKFVTIAEQADKSGFDGFKSQFIEMFKGDNQVPLGDICNIEKGATITRNDVLPGEVPVVAGGQEPSCYHNVANREAGAITVSASGAYAGYINFWNCPIFASDCNTIISKDDEKTDQTFVYFGLRAMQKQIYGLQKGGAQPHVYGKDLQKFMFPCPSYAKQIEFSKMAKQADKSGFELRKSIEAIDQVIKSLINN